MQTKGFQFFIKDPTVSSRILAVFKTSTVTYERQVNEHRPIKKQVPPKMTKTYTRTKFSCVDGHNGKESTRYSLTELKRLSKEEVLSLFPKQCDKFKKIFHNELH